MSNQITNQTAVFQPRAVFLISGSDDPLIKPLIGKVFQVLFCEDAGVLANPEAGQGSEVVYIAFNQTDFDLSVVGNFAFAPIHYETGVYDTAGSPGNEHVGLMSFCNDQAFLDELIAVSKQPPIYAMQPPDFSPEPSWNEMFAQGTVFCVDQTDNPVFKRYQGIVFRTINATQTGVLAVAQVGVNAPDTLWLPLDGQTTFTINPPGTFTFPNLEADDQVYDVVTMTYAPVVDFYSWYFSDYYFSPICW